jgi:hypothetical protein
MSNPGFPSFDDQRELDSLRSRSKNIHKECEAKSAILASSLELHSVDVAGALQKVLGLTLLVTELCLKDDAEYIKHAIALQDGQVDEALLKLKDTCHDAYEEIKDREARFHLMQKQVLDNYAAFTNLVGRMEGLQQRGDLAQEKILAARKWWEAERVRRRELLATEMREYEEEVAAYNEKQRKIENKYRVNSNLFTGIGDFFSRSDVCYAHPNGL